MVSECYCEKCLSTRSGAIGLVCNVVINKRRRDHERRRRERTQEKNEKTVQSHLGVYIQPSRWGGWMNNQIKRELLHQASKRQKPSVGERREPQDTLEK